MMELNNVDIKNYCFELAKKICLDFNQKGIAIFGVPRGGIPVAYLLTGFLSGSYVVDSPEEADIIVDDIIDSGETEARYKLKYEKPFYVLVNKKELGIVSFVYFPWEVKDKSTPVFDNILRIEQFLFNASYEDKEKVFNELSHIKEMCLKR